MGCGSSAAKDPKSTGFDKQSVVKQKLKNFFDDYILEKSLGSGTYGEVWSVTHRTTKDIRAVKMIKKSAIKTQAKLEELIKSEIESLIKLDCPNIMKVHAVYEDAHKYFVVQEYLKGPTLLDYFSKMIQNEYNEKQIAAMMKQILTALNYCHSNGVVHRDIKPDNMMFAESECKTLKIIDFGFAKIVDPVDKKFKEVLGSPMYMAPEVCGKKTVDSKCDIWSCGIVAHLLLSGEFPFLATEKAGLSNLFEQINTKTFKVDDLNSGAWKLATPAAKMFTIRMLQKDPKDRPTAGELLNDPWIVNTPETKISNDEAKNYLGNLLNTTADFKFQHAVITYIAHHADLKEKRESLDRFFKHLDKDKSQTITKDELKEGFKESGVVISDTDFDALFTKLDTSKNGSISYTEYCAGAVDLSILTNDKYLEDAFNFFDVDKTRTLNKDKLKNALANNWISEVQLSQLFEEVDTNKDAKIGLEEFKKAMKAIAMKQKA